MGHIFALTSITATTGATVEGQLLARNGAVTLDTNIITNAICEFIPSVVDDKEVVSNGGKGVKLLRTSGIDLLYLALGGVTVAGGMLLKRKQK